MARIVWVGLGVGILVGGMAGMAVAGGVGAAVGAGIGLVGGVLFGILLGAPFRISSQDGTAEVARRVACTGTGKVVDATLVVDEASGKVLDVVECSAFHPCHHITCDKHCVELIDNGELRTETPKATAAGR